MSFDLSDLSITTIGYDEPILWVAIALASILAMLVGYPIGTTIGQLGARSRRLYGLPVSGAAALLLVLVTVFVLDKLFTYYHRGMVCTVFVTPVLFIPALIALSVERLAWKRAAAGSGSMIVAPTTRILLQDHGVECGKRPPNNAMQQTRSAGERTGRPLQLIAVFGGP